MSPETGDGQFFFVKFDVKTGQALEVINPAGETCQFDLERAVEPRKGPVEVVLIHPGSYCIRRGDGSIVCF